MTWSYRVRTVHVADQLRHPLALGGRQARSRASSITSSSWRADVGGVHSRLGASCVVRVSGSYDSILRLLRDDVVVRGELPRFRRRREAHAVRITPAMTPAVR